MKTKTVKVSPPTQKGFSPKADALGAKYETLVQEAEEAKKKVDDTKEGARGLALQEGTSDGKVTRVQGDKYEITVTDVMSTPTLDHEKLAASLPPAKRKLCFVEQTVQVLDEKKLIAAVEDGHISPVLVHAATSPSVKKHERIVIKRL